MILIIIIVLAILVVTIVDLLNEIYINKFNLEGNLKGFKLNFETKKKDVFNTTFIIITVL